MKKLKTYLKSKNPYLLASVAIVVLSVGMIIAILQDTSAESADQDMDVIVQENVSELLETEPQDIQISAESEEMDVIEIGKEEKAEPEKEILESTGEGAESASESRREPEPASEPEWSFEQVEEPESEVDPGVIPESTEEIVPESIPEENCDETPEIPPDEDASEPPVTEPEDPIFEPEEVPEPEVHEHSWIFESFYQEPTCSNGGLENQICAHCGETQTTIGTPTGKHIYEVESPGDCCSAEVIICTECNHREVKEKDTDKHIDEEDGFCYGCGQKAE